MPNCGRSRAAPDYRDLFAIIASEFATKTKPLSSMITSAYSRSLRSSTSSRSELRCRKPIYPPFCPRFITDLTISKRFSSSNNSNTSNPQPSITSDHTTKPTHSNTADSSNIAAKVLQIGLTNQQHRKVELHNTTNRKKKAGADILNTPSMILFMEQTAAELAGIISPDHINLIKPRWSSSLSLSLKETRLPTGFATVGYHVDIKHLAATPLGKTILAKAELIEIGGSKLTFNVTAHEVDETTQSPKLIGKGLHRRAVIRTEDD